MLVAQKPRVSELMTFQCNFSYKNEKTMNFHLRNKSITIWTTFEHPKNSMSLIYFKTLIYFGSKIQKICTDWSQIMTWDTTRFKNEFDKFFSFLMYHKVSVAGCSFFLIISEPMFLRSKNFPKIMRHKKDDTVNFYTKM